MIDRNTSKTMKQHTAGKVSQTNKKQLEEDFPTQSE